MIERRSEFFMREQKAVVRLGRRLVLGALAILILLLGSKVFARHCALNYAQPGYAHESHYRGYEFLVMPLTYEEFWRLVHERPDRIQATRSGITLDTPDGPIIRSGEGRFRRALLPLHREDVDLWAHHPLSTGDSISMGTRYRSLKGWQIGLIFPMSVLESYDFVVADTSTVASRAQALGTGRGHLLFDSTRDDFVTFGPVLSEARANRYPNSFDYQSSMEIHLKQEVELSRASLLWIPKPLHDWISANPESFKQGEPPPRQETLGVQISQQPPTIMLEVRINGVLIGSTPGPQTGEWSNVRPPRIDNLSSRLFDPERRLGLWYETMPDWEQVRRTLETEGGDGFGVF